MSFITTLRALLFCLAALLAIVPACGGDDDDDSADGDADADADSDGDADSDTDADSDGDADSDSDADSDGDADADVDADADADGDADGDECAAQDAAGQGNCDAWFGYYWMGCSCGGYSGCNCVGDDCGQAFETEEACNAAYAGCPLCGANGSDPGR
jgi:hypothetical protein